MAKLRLTVFYLAILTLAGCTQTATYPTKATAGKPGAAQSQPPASYAPSERGGDGGGGGY